MGMWLKGLKRGGGAGLYYGSAVVVMVGGFAEGIVVARDMVMKPSPIGFAWGHISSTRAIVGVVRMVLSSRLIHGYARIVGGRWLVQGRYMMGCWYRKRLAEKLGVCRFLPDSNL